MTRFLVLAVLGFSVALHSSPNSVTVNNGRRILKSASGYQTVSELDGGKTGLYYDVGEYAGRLNPKAQMVVLLGLGGGEMLRAARRTLPQANMTGVEIDDFTAHEARTTFGMSTLGVGITIGDAVLWIKKAAPGSIDVLMVDLYEDSELVPEARSPAFFASCARALSPGGTLIMNVYPASLYSSVASGAAAAGITVWRDDTWAPNAILIGRR